MSGVPASADLKLRPLEPGGAVRWRHDTASSAVLPAASTARTATKRGRGPGGGGGESAEAAGGSGGSGGSGQLRHDDIDDYQRRAQRYQLTPAPVRSTGVSGAAAVALAAVASTQAQPPRSPLSNNHQRPPPWASTFVALTEATQDEGFPVEAPSMAREGRQRGRRRRDTPKAKRATVAAREDFPRRHGLRSQGQVCTTVVFGGVFPTRCPATTAFPRARVLSTPEDLSRHLCRATGRSVAVTCG